MALAREGRTRYVVPVVFKETKRKVLSLSVFELIVDLCVFMTKQRFFDYLTMINLKEIFYFNS